MWLSRVGRWSATATRTTVTRPTSAAALRTTVTLPATRRHLLTAASTQHASTRTKVWKSPYPPVEIVNKPIYDYYMEAIEKHIKHDPHRIAFRCAMNPKDTVSYSQLKEQSTAVAAFLHKLGFGRGCVSAVMLPNVTAYPVFTVGVAATGGAISGVNPMYTDFELMGQLSNSESSVVFVHELLLEKVMTAKKKCPKVKTVICLRCSPNPLPAGVHDWNDVIKTKGAVPTSGATPEDVAVIPYSSGTTGAPKGVMLSSRAAACVIETYCKHVEGYIVKNVFGGVWDWQKEHQLLQLPFYHVFGFFQLMHTLVAGSPGVCVPKFDPDLFCATIEKYQVKQMMVVPPMLLLLVKHPAATKRDLSCLKFVMSGAAPVGKDLCEEFLKKYNVFLGQAFGLSELGLASHVPMCNDPKGYIHCGALAANMEMKIIDQNTGAELGDGEVGELCIRSPGQMSGYLNNRKATEETIVDGWIHTGDIAYSNEKSHLFIVDRKKELIKVKGLQVAPAELEDVLLGHPLIADAAVIGVANERNGEAPKAFVIRADENLTERDVQQYIEKHLAEHKWLLGGVEFVSSIPKSPAGKIIRRILRDQEAAKQKKTNSIKL